MQTEVYFRASDARPITVDHRLVKEKYLRQWVGADDERLAFGFDLLFNSGIRERVVATRDMAEALIDCDGAFLVLSMTGLQVETRYRAAASGEWVDVDPAMIGGLRIVTKETEGPLNEVLIRLYRKAGGHIDVRPRPEDEADVRVALGSPFPRATVR